MMNYEKDLTLLEVPKKIPDFHIKKGFSWGKFFMNIFLGLCFIFVIIYSYAYFTFKVIFAEGVSMKPTINLINNTEDRIFTSFLAKPERGSIVIYSRYDSSKVTPHFLVIKRMIADSGDKIKITLYDNVPSVLLIKKGTTDVIKLDEKYILSAEGMRLKTIPNFENLKNTPQWSAQFNDKGFLLIPDGYAFCLGDNRMESMDCSDYGPIKKSDIECVALGIVPEKELSMIYTLKYVLTNLGLCNYKLNLFYD